MTVFRATGLLQLGVFRSMRGISAALQRAALTGLVRRAPVVTDTRESAYILIVARRQP